MRTTGISYADQIRQMQEFNILAEREAFCQKTNARLFGLGVVMAVALAITIAHTLNPELMAKVLSIETYSTQNVIATIRAILPILS